MNSRIPVLSLLSAALVASCLAAAPSVQDDKKSEVNPRWLEKMDNLDRSLLDENVGYAAPDMPNGLEWKETDKPLTWEDLRGKVVVVQSWTSKDSPGRAAIERAENVLKPFGEQVKVIALHTPDGSEGADKFLKQREMTMPVILDREGKFCDEFGFFKKPANVVIDKHGIIRYAGLNPNGLREAVKGLIDEAFDPEKKGEPRPAPELKDTSDIEWPPHNTGRLSAANVQGKKGPALFAETWVSAQPDLTGKVVIIDFSATWCPPCRASFPHMSQLQEKFRGSLEIIAITNETPQAFRDGLTKYNIAPASIKFSVASDPATRTMKAVNGNAWPHALVLSADWVVRWQGHPAELNEQTLRQIIAANSSMAGTTLSRYRWSGGK